MIRRLGFGDFFGAVRNQEATPGFAFHEIVRQPRDEIPRHTHDGAHFCIVLRGHYLSRIGRRERIYGASTVLFHPAGTTHRDRFDSPTGACLTVSLGNRWEEILRSRGRGPDRSLVFSDGELGWTGTKLYHELRSADDLTPLVLEGLGTELLAAALRRRNREEPVPPPWLDAARELIAERCLEPLAIAEVARSFSIHPVHLARTFRRFLRCTPGEFLRRCRVNHASSLLRDSELPLALVALESGFCDQSQLTRSFRKETGLTPGQFRRRFGSPDGASPLEPRE